MSTLLEHISLLADQKALLPVGVLLGNYAPDVSKEDIKTYFKHFEEHVINNMMKSGQLDLRNDFDDRTSSKFSPFMQSLLKVPTIFDKQKQTAVEKDFRLISLYVFFLISIYKVVVAFVQAMHREAYDMENVNSIGLELDHLLTSASDIENYGELLEYITIRLDVLFKMCTPQTKQLACTKVQIAFRNTNFMTNAVQTMNGINNLYSHTEVHKVDTTMQIFVEEKVKGIEALMKVLKAEMIELEQTGNTPPQEKNKIKTKLEELQKKIWICNMQSEVLEKRISNVAKNARFEPTKEDIATLSTMPLRALQRIGEGMCTFVKPLFMPVLSMSTTVLLIIGFCVAINWIMLWSNFSWWNNFIVWSNISEQERIQWSFVEGWYDMLQDQELSKLPIPDEVIEIHSAKTIHLIEAVSKLNTENAKAFGTALIGTMYNFIPPLPKIDDEQSLVYGLSPHVNRTLDRHVTQQHRIGDIYDIGRCSLTPGILLGIISNSLSFFASALTSVSKNVLPGDVIIAHSENAAKQQYVDIGMKYYLAEATSTSTYTGVDESIQSLTIRVLKEALQTKERDEATLETLKAQLRKEQETFAEIQNLQAINDNDTIQKIKDALKNILESEDRNMAAFLDHQLGFATLASKSAENLLKGPLQKGSTHLRVPTYFQQGIDTLIKRNIGTGMLHGIQKVKDVLGVESIPEMKQSQFARFTELVDTISTELEDKKKQTDRVQIMRALWLQVCFWSMYNKWLSALQGADTHNKEHIEAMMLLTEHRETASIWKMAREVYTLDNRDKEFMEDLNMIYDTLKGSTGQNLGKTAPGTVTVTTEMLEDVSNLRNYARSTSEALIDLGKKLKFTREVVPVSETDTNWQQALDNFGSNLNKITKLKKEYVSERQKLKELKEKKTAESKKDDIVQPTACAADILEDRADLRHMCALETEEARASDNTTHTSHIRQMLRIMASTGCSVLASGCSNSGSNMRMTHTLVSSSGSLDMISSIPSCSGTRRTPFRGPLSRY